jgi:multicomponent Na+:H+ antiporter subunit G
VAVTPSSVAVAVLLIGAGVLAVVSVLGVALMPGVYNKLHYLAPVSVVGAGAIAAAIVVRELLNTRGIKALIVFGILAGLNPVLAHATARAARIREEGDWRIETSPRASKRGRT